MHNFLWTCVWTCRADSKVSLTAGMTEHKQPQSYRCQWLTGLFLSLISCIHFPHMACCSFPDTRYSSGVATLCILTLFSRVLIGFHAATGLWPGASCGRALLTSSKCYGQKPRQCYSNKREPYISPRLILLLNSSPCLCSQRRISSSVYADKEKWSLF